MRAQSAESVVEQRASSVSGNTAKYLVGPDLFLAPKPCSTRPADPDRAEAPLLSRRVDEETHRQSGDSRSRLRFQRMLVQRKDD